MGLNRAWWNMGSNPGYCYQAECGYGWVWTTWLLEASGKQYEEQDLPLPRQR